MEGANSVNMNVLSIDGIEVEEEYVHSHYTMTNWAKATNGNPNANT